MRYIYISILFFVIQLSSGQIQQRVDASDVIARRHFYLPNIDLISNPYRPLVIDTVTGIVMYADGSAELDPLFLNSVAYGITAADTSYWGTNYWKQNLLSTYNDGLVTIGGDGNGLSLSGRNLYVYGGARIDQLLDIEGATPLLNFRNLTDQTVATVEHLGGGDMQIRFINRLGLWNAPEESLDIPGTIKMRGIQSVAPTPTMKMVVMDSVDKVAQLIDLPELNINYGVFDNDEDAATNGVPINGTYTLSINNTLGASTGNTRKRIF